MDPNLPDSVPDVVDPPLIGIISKLAMKVGYDLAKEVANRAGRAWALKNWQEFGVQDEEQLPITTFAIAKPAEKLGTLIAERQSQKTAARPGPQMTKDRSQQQPKPQRRGRRGWRERTIQHP